MYRVLLTTNRGLEDITAQEVEEILGVKAIPRPFGVLGRVMFEINDLLKVAEFTYITKTANRVIVFLDSFEVERDDKGLETIYKKVKEIDWTEYMERDQTFAVRCERMGIHTYTSIDVCRVAGQAIIDQIMEKTGHRQKVNLEEPDVIVRVDVIGSRCFVGIDFVGEVGLHKRGYKIYHHPAALRTTLANQMVRLSGWNKDKVLLDPMCGSGTIPIEACLNVTNTPGAYWRKDKLQFTKLNVFKDIDWDSFFEKIDEKINRDIDVEIYAFDKFIKHVRGAEANATRASVRNLIKFARVDLEWLDVKMEEKSVDVIVTNPPYGLKVADPEEAEKCHKLLFYQADWVLKDDGKVVLISARPDFVEKWSQYYKFKKVHEREVLHGKLKAKIYIFQKEKR